MSSIAYKKGDLLRGPEFVIAHGCNALGVMGAGIAKQIKQVYPGAFRAYHEEHGRSGLRLGQVVPWVGKDRVVLNMITQETFGSTPGMVYVDYDGLRQCMRNLEKAAVRHQAAGAGPLHDHRVVGMPKIGAGLAGGDWSTIAEIIEAEVRSVRVVVYEI